MVVHGRGSSQPWRNVNVWMNGMKGPHFHSMSFLAFVLQLGDEQCLAHLCTSCACIVCVDFAWIEMYQW
jgi:hypothetical protein